MKLAEKMQKINHEKLIEKEQAMMAEKKREQDEISWNVKIIQGFFEEAILYCEKSVEQGELPKTCLVGKNIPGMTNQLQKLDNSGYFKPILDTLTDAFNGDLYMRQIISMIENNKKIKPEAKKQYTTAFENVIRWAEQNDLSVKFRSDHDGCGRENWHVLEIKPKIGYQTEITPGM